MTTTHTTTPHRAGRALALWLSLAAGLGMLGALGGCRGDREDKPPREFFPDLDNQLKWKPQSTSEFFADGRTMRVPDSRAVAFGRQSLVSDEPWAAASRQTREDLLKDDSVFYTGVTGRDAKGEPVYAATIPASVTVDSALLLRGQDRFNIYCTACHGYLGDGKGPVGVQFNPIAADFHTGPFKDPKALQNQDGYLFHTIRHGKLKADGSGTNTMPGYAHAINERDSWAIVAYMRALQASREGTLQDVPAAMRGELERTRGATPAGGTQ
jgi:mono/diheme cytochrome c family protein